MIEARVRTGDTAQAERELSDYATDVERTGRARGHATPARLRGLLASDAELDTEFGDALDWHAGAQCPFEEARTRLAYGERLRRARRRVDARRQLAEALTAFEELGAREFAARASGELAAAG